MLEELSRSAPASYHDSSKSESILSQLRQIFVLPRSNSSTAMALNNFTSGLFNNLFKIVDMNIAACMQCNCFTRQFYSLSSALMMEGFLKKITSSYVHTNRLVATHKLFMYDIICGSHEIEERRSLSTRNKAVILIASNAALLLIALCKLSLLRSFQTVFSVLGHMVCPESIRTLVDSRS